MKLLFNIIKDHIVWLPKLLQLAKADIVKTYKGAAFGWSWALVKPAMNIFVFWFVFQIGLGFRDGTGGAGYLLWLMAGLMPWFYMTEAITNTANSLRQYSFLVTKMKFPIATIPTFVNFSKLFIHILLMIITIVFFMLMGQMPTIYYLQIPFYMLLTFIFFSIWGILSSMLTAVSRDFFNLVEAFVQVLFWLSGVLWSVEGLLGQVGHHPRLYAVLMFNPVTFLVTGYRNAMIENIWFWEHPEKLGAFGIVTFVLLTLALLAYNKLYKEVPDIL
jgi:teichoic acid transport system permease protein